MRRIDRWLIELDAGIERQATIILFPFAGGGASYFRAWPAKGSQFSFYCAELPGRGYRFAEPFANSLTECAAAIADSILKWRRGPIYLAGHSMGSLIATEVAHLLEQSGHSVAHLLVSGCGAPGSVRAALKGSLTDHLISLGGIPSELSESTDFMSMLKTVFTSDIGLIDDYVPREILKLSCPIIVCSGDSDEILQRSDIQDWRKVTDGQCDFVPMKGGHFYQSGTLFELREELIKRFVLR
ncbi:alpha/beta fold hydrolase [Rhizobium sp. ZPR3]|uniref:Alpha/beta fold hydrolase n=2 Tax=unclassified Rhizobium TaxID=2613769 RepID=A0AAU7S9L5_9HYPH